MKKNRNIKILIIAVGVFSICLIEGVIFAIFKNSGNDENVTYRETAVQHGDLTVGITEDSSVSIGTLTQSFDLDISALINSSTSGSQSNSSGGGMSFGGGSGGSTGGFGGIGGGAMMDFSSQSAGFSSKSQSMEIEGVNITVGQKISAGDVIYTLSTESVDKIRNQLVEDIDETLAEYNSIQVEQQESRIQAKQKYDTYVLNGKLSSVEYNYTLVELEDAVAKAKDNLTDIEDNINSNLADIVSLNQELAQANKDLKEAEYAVSLAYENRFEESYYYAVYKLAMEDAKKIVDDIESEIKKFEEENEALVKNFATAQRSYNEALRKQESGKLTADQTLETTNYESSVASNWYKLQIEGLYSSVESIYKSYQDASEKLSEFDKYIVGNDVISEYSGVVTAVSLKEGDNVTKNTTLVTLYNQDDVTMDVTISEDDYKTIDLEGSVNILFDAYPDDVYEGVISEVSDATYDSSTATVYYTITITIKGNVTGLYEGMTGEATFVTKESKEVNYVSNRAIFRDGTRSYVKVYDVNGKVIEKNVVTGFSDGVNVEIVEGLSDGDVVLIESKVSES